MNKFFSVAIGNSELSDKDIADCIRSVTANVIIVEEVERYGAKIPSLNQTISEVMQSSSEVHMSPRKPAKAESPQQPTVPIQFVYLVDKGDLYSVDESPNVAACTVEQIGAVLYVRGKQ